MERTTDPWSAGNGPVALAPDHLPSPGQARTGHAWVHNVHLLRPAPGPMHNTTNHNQADKARRRTA